MFGNIGSPFPFYLENASDFWKMAKYAFNKLKEDPFWQQNFETGDARMINFKISNGKVNLVMQL